jgi:hypothetical protein
MKMVGMPKKKGGYTRGDILKGFKGIGNDQNFWLIGAGRAWTVQGEGWQASAIRVPELTDPFVKGVLPLGSSVCWILSPSSRGQRLFDAFEEGDRIYSTSGNEWKVCKGYDVFFSTKDFVVSPTAGYILTKSGQIVMVMNGTLSKIDSPSTCDALAIGDHGTLLGCFHDLGIFEFGSGWKKRMELPFKQDSGLEWIRLAELQGVLALARTVAPEPHDPESIGLWISAGKSWKKVVLAPGEFGRSQRR